MIAIIEGLVFIGGFAMAVIAIIASIVPQWQRIVGLAGGNVQAVAYLPRLRRLPEYRMLVSYRSIIGLRLPPIRHYVAA